MDTSTLKKDLGIKIVSMKNRQLGMIKRSLVTRDRQSMLLLYKLTQEISSRQYWHMESMES